MLVVVVFRGRGCSRPYDAILGDSGWRTREDNDICKELGDVLGAGLRDLGCATLTGRAGLPH